jgi:c(7)-type cytochrome triheme protein
MNMRSSIGTRARDDAAPAAAVSANPGTAKGRSLPTVFWRRAWRFAALALMLALGLGTQPASAEYGDVVINNYADGAGMRPVVFPHWFHRIRFACKVCHADLGFKFKAGGNEITMAKIIDGQFCGACHNGDVAWSIENCNMCHSGKPGTPTQVHGSTVQRLVIPQQPAPVAKP